MSIDIGAFILGDPWRLSVLHVVRDLGLPDWAVGAGFVRNAVWDRLHSYERPTPLDDVDVLFFDPDDCTTAREAALERALAAAMPGVPWSVRNQARMHLRNGDSPYKSTEDALRYWLETATCVAVRLEPDDRLTVIAPLGLDDLLALRSGPHGTRTGAPRGLPCAHAGKELARPLAEGPGRRFVKGGREWIGRSGVLYLGGSAFAL